MAGKNIQPHIIARELNLEKVAALVSDLKILGYSVTNEVDPLKLSCVKIHKQD